MKYLRGSLIEVQELSKIFSGATVFTGTDMTENRIKAMARDGSLKRFRVIHLATHGFAQPVTGDRQDRGHSVSPPTAST